MELMRKLYTAEVKKTGERAYQATITTDVEDRQGQRVLPGGGKLADYLRNPVVLYAHNYSDLPVARALSIAPEGNGLVATFEFPAPGVYDRADQVRLLWDTGFLNAVSIGFIPTAGLDKEGKPTTYFWEAATITEWELLEFSIVPVPANQEALRRMAGASEKEGRVLSSKNRQLIKTAVGTMQDAIAALEELLEATDPEKAAEPDADADIEPNTTVSAEMLLALQTYFTTVTEAWK